MPFTLEELQEGKVFLIDKPLDWTSFDAVNKIKWRIKKAFDVKKIKVGHAGTLDPRATGLLIVCVGKATKGIQEIQDASKVYTGTIKLGVKTPSFDTETEEIESKDISHITEEQIIEVFKTFIGEAVEQVPPVYSALKKDGKRLYEYARKGEEVQVQKRIISIYSFEVEEMNLPLVSFRVHCGKGTYIRSLANDVGEKLGVGGYLISLRREQIGEHKVENADKELLVNEDYFSNPETAD